MTTERTNDEAELAAWDTDVGADQWARDRDWRHPSTGFGSTLAEAGGQIRAAHAIATRPGAGGGPGRSRIHSGQSPASRKCGCAACWHSTRSCGDHTPYLYVGVTNQPQPVAMASARHTSAMRTGLRRQMRSTKKAFSRPHRGLPGLRLYGGDRQRMGQEADLLRGHPLVTGDYGCVDA
jgi:hypothetical protein